MDPVDLDKLRLSYQSMLEQRGLSAEQLRSLAATLFVTSFATAAQCEEALADRDIDNEELAKHIDAMSTSLSHGNVLATLDFLREMPDRFRSARLSGESAVKSKIGRATVKHRLDKWEKIGKYACDLAGEKGYTSIAAAARAIKDRVQAYAEEELGVRMMATNLERKICELLSEGGYKPGPKAAR